MTLAESPRYDKHEYIFKFVFEVTPLIVLLYPEIKDTNSLR